MTNGHLETGIEINPETVCTVNTSQIMGYAQKNIGITER
jgi:hypothetical protein